MNYELYLNQMREIQCNLMQFLESEGGTKDFDEFIHFLSEMCENIEVFYGFLCLLSKISENYHRSATFYDKIKHILNYYRLQIKQFFTSSQLFNIFKDNNNILLLFLIKKLLIVVDHSIAEYLKKNRDQKYFLYPEIDKFLDATESDHIEDEIIDIDPDYYDKLDEKRRKGENTSYICSLIRDDSIIEFIQYVNRTNYSLNGFINNSIYETNSFLMKKSKISLIEYAAFYGAIEIFNYLRFNNVELTPSLWLYVIHSKNPDLIHLLEENQVIPDDKTYGECLQTAIECHHNNIANYILDNLYVDNGNQYLIKEKAGIENYNFEFFPDNLNEKYIVSYIFPEIFQFFIQKPGIKIDDYLFCLSKKLVKITIPESVISIGNHAFSKCSSLTEVEILSPITIIEPYTFSDCTSLEQFTIPPSVISIEKFAFNKCSSLSNIQISPSVVSIGSYAFKDCIKLKQIEIPSSVRVIKEGCFYNCEQLEEIIIPNTVISIQDCVFKKCGSLSRVSLPDSMMIISNELFNQCNSLNEIKIPSSVKIIGLGSFKDCWSLERIILPSCLQYIGSFAFEGCFTLQNFCISQPLIAIGENIFSKCRRLNLRIDATVIKGGFTGRLQTEDIESFKVSKYRYQKNSLLYKINVLSSISSIGKWCFSCCSSLSIINFQIPSSLKKIGKYAFFGCISLKKISIPTSVITIKDSAFEECISLEKVTFKSPSSLQSIGNFVFKGCSVLNKDKVRIPTTAKCGEFIFLECGECI